MLHPIIGNSCNFFSINTKDITENTKNANFTKI